MTRAMTSAVHLIDTLSLELIAAQLKLHSSLLLYCSRYWRKSVIFLLIYSQTTLDKCVFSSLWAKLNECEIRSENILDATNMLLFNSPRFIISAQILQVSVKGVHITTLK